MENILKGSKICWDFHGTIFGEGGLRKNIKEVLSQIVQEGGANYLNCASHNNFRSQLDYLGISPYFKKIISERNRAKEYESIAKDANLSIQEGMHNMISIGDEERDRSEDIPGMVFLMVPSSNGAGQGRHFDSYLIKVVLINLYKSGDKSFAKGFEKLSGLAALVNYDNNLHFESDGNGSNSFYKQNKKSISLDGKENQKISLEFSYSLIKEGFGWDNSSNRTLLSPVIVPKIVVTNW